MVTPPIFIQYSLLTSHKQAISGASGIGGNLGTAEQLSVFPNPTHYNFTIQSEGIPNDTYCISLMNMIGEVVKSIRADVSNN